MLGRIIGLVLAVLLMAVGVLWTLGGLGHLDGSTEGGKQAYAIIGPLVAGLGLALAIVIVQNRRRG